MGNVPDYLAVGDGPAILFLHGLGGDKTNWQPQFDEFSPDFRCIAWTMPGYGDSPPLDPMTWPGLANGAAAVLDDAGVTSATVVGLSMGGYVAQQLAGDHPDRVTKLMLAATTAQFGRGSESFAERFLAARLQPIDEGAVPADFAGDVVTGLLSEHADETSVAVAVASMANITAPAYRAALACLVTWNFVQRLPELQMATACVAGDNDRTAPVASVLALADGLPNATLHVIEDCRHILNLDQPADFNRILRAVLER